MNFPENKHRASLNSDSGLLTLFPLSAIWALNPHVGEEKGVSELLSDWMPIVCAFSLGHKPLHEADTDFGENKPFEELSVSPGII